MMLVESQQENANHEVHVAPDLMRHFRLLSDQDQLLVQMTCQLGLTHRQVGTVLRTSPGTVTRRLHRLLQLLRDPLVVALVQPGCNLAPLHRKVALEHLLHRRSIYAIARRHRISRRRVRRMIEYTRGWFGAQEKKRRM
jgi:hypothetical protein